MTLEAAQKGVGLAGPLGAKSRGFLDGYDGAIPNTLTTFPKEYGEGYQEGAAAKKKGTPDGK